MDSSGSSSSMAMSNNREAPSSSAALAATAEDEVALSVASGLAKEAALLFQSGKFKDCIRVLNQLLLNKEGDPKVLHNIVIAENSQDGCSNPKRLIEELNNFKKQNEHVVGPSGDRAEATGNVGIKTVAGIKGTNSSANQDSSLHSSQAVYADEFDSSVAMYNLAVSWFHLHEYAKAFSILEALFQNIEPIDEDTAKHICLLLLDVSLLSQNARRSMDVIGYVEKVFCNNSLMNQAASGNSTQQSASTIVAKSVSVSNNSTVSDAPASDSAVTAINSEGSLARSLSEERLEDDTLHLISSIEMSGQNPPRQPGIQPSNDLLKNQADESISTNDMRIKLHLCKVRFLLLTRNVKAAKREVKMAMNMARGKDYSMALYLKSQLEYARGNHQKAVRLLMASSNRTEMGISSIYYNNLGCIYYRLGKYHSSAVFFSKALSSSSPLRKEKPLKLSNISQDKSFLIVYNCGMQYLACGKPLQAACCFYKARHVFSNSPLLWLRIAECCLMALEKGLLKSTTSVSSDKSGFEVHVIGKGKWRQLVIDDGLSRIGQGNSIGGEDLVLGDGQPNLSMIVARQCLLNALILLSRSESKDGVTRLPNAVVTEENESREVVLSKTTNYKNASGSDTKASNAAVSGQINANGELKEQKGGNNQNASLLSSISDYEDICRKENQMLEQALLADLAYVHLELGDPLRALSTARSLLKLTECSKIYTFLGNVYAAEALCLLSRPKEAAEHLSMYLSGGKGVDQPFSQEDVEAWRVEKVVDSEESNGGSTTMNESQGFVFLKPEEARGILFANLAAMSAVQGDFEQAQAYAAAAVSIIPRSTKAMLTAIYVDLLQGKTKEAVGKLRQCSSVRFIPNSLPTNGSSL
nr:CCR4-NOT transcription complex subunit 10 [Ipomoea batatas]